MKTVIDVGCARYGGDYSVERLIEMFQPDVLYGFDPNVDGVKAAWPKEDTGVQVVLSTAAAWTFDGQVRFMADGLAGMVGEHDHWSLVQCIDLAKFIEDLPAGELILKLDAEGAEIDLLEHLIKTKVDFRLTQVLVEWHPWNDQAKRRRIERRLTCPLEEWRW